MKLNEFKLFYASLNPDQQLRYLLSLSHNLTICARSASLPQAKDAPARRLLLALNELQHQLSSCLMHMVSKDPNLYPPDVFADLLLEIAATESCESDLAQAIDWSRSALREST